MDTANSAFPYSEEEIQAFRARARAVYQQKLRDMHRGPCSSLMAGRCPCTDYCPYHGRCCDCIHHHRQSRMCADQSPDTGETFGWLPHCVRDTVYIYNQELRTAFERERGIPFTPSVSADAGLPAAKGETNRPETCGPFS